MDPVRVTWVDSGMHIDHGWASAETYREGTTVDRMSVTTVGMLVAEEADTLLVALNHDPAHDTYLSMQLILRSDVISFERLRGPGDA